MFDYIWIIKWKYEKIILKIYKRKKKNQGTFFFFLMVWQFLIEYMLIFYIIFIISKEMVWWRNNNWILNFITKWIWIKFWLFFSYDLINLSWQHVSSFNFLMMISMTWVWKGFNFSRKRRSHLMGPIQLMILFWSFNLVFA